MTISTLPLLFVAIFITSANSGDNFRCPAPNSSYCSCSQNGNTFYIRCGVSVPTDRIMIMIINAGESVVVQCNKDTPLSAYEELPFGNNSYVKNINLDCRSPDITFGIIIRNMRITKVKVLIFRSYNDTLTNHSENNMKDCEEPSNTLPQLFLANVDHIEEVDLNKNKLEELPENLFNNSTNLKSISLNNNMLTHIPPNIFRHQKNLLKLDLSYNNITTLSHDVFCNLENLKTLILDNNFMEHLERNFLSSLIKLEELSIKHNKIRTIEEDALDSFRKTLTKINLSHNFIGMFKASPLQKCRRLIDVNLSYNNISEICEGWKESLYYLKKLNLSHNHFTNIQYAPFNIYPIVIVDLTFNDIKTISMIGNKPKHTDRKVPKILVENNPVICDCHLHDFIEYFENKPESHVWDGVNNLSCADPPNLRGKLIKNVKLDELLCRVDEPCPNYCECYKRYYDKAFIVKCSSISEQQVPAIPENPEETNHTELHLQNNQVTSFRKLQLNRNVTKLYLQNNMITDLKLSENIEVLDLSNNRLQYLDDGEVAMLNHSRLKELRLCNNSLACDCSNFAFLSFLQDRRRKIMDYESLKCADGQSIPRLKLSTLCGSNPKLVVVLPLLVLGGIFIGTGAALFWRYNHQIKIYLFSKGWFLSWVTEEEIDKDKLYDAFLSFSHKDEDFVINELVAKLENGPQAHKLCIHFRDWIAGEMIPTQIRRSVEDSRRTIVVLSPNYLESIWGQLEFKEAYSHALQEGRSRVIIILYCNNKELDNLEPELQSYLENNTYVEWGDPWFWKKLRYALPHGPSLM